MAYKDFVSLGIIPARGGSKGIPGKNVKLLSGKPLIAWTIEAAKSSKHLDRVIVSTDDEEIATIALEWGAEVPFMRPAEIAGDLATDLEFIDHALEFLEKAESYTPDIVLRLPPTSPLRTAHHIDIGIETLVNTEGADASRPIVEVDKHPYKFWQMHDTDERFLKPFLTKEHTGFNEPHNLPRQLFPKVYRHTGAMDVVWMKTIKEQRSTSGKMLAHFLMTEEESTNIDHPIDFDLAELLIKRRFNQ